MDDQVKNNMKRALFNRLSRYVDAAEGLVGAESRYGSPIEFALAAAFYFVSTMDQRGVTYEQCFDLDDEACKSYLTTWGPQQYPGTSAAIFPQVKIGRYTADFFAVYGVHNSNDIRGIVIECDGHDFHEKTKEQAAHDKGRDRALQSVGYKVLRFTGAEIWRDPVACATEVIADINGMQGEAFLGAHDIKPPIAKPTTEPDYKRLIADVETVLS